MQRDSRLKVNKYDKNLMPAEVKHAIALIQNRLSNMPNHIEKDLGITDYAVCSKYDEHWIIGSDFEDGSSSCFWDGNQWMYIEPFEGGVNKVPGGLVEVVANTTCMITRGAM